MNDHDRLKELAANPGLIEQEPELNELLEHSQSCSECSDLLNKSSAFFEAVAEPLVHIGPHLSARQLVWMRWRGFQPGSDPAKGIEQWHLTCCPDCRSRYGKPAGMWFRMSWRWASAVTALVIVGTLLFYYLRPWGTGDETYRAPGKLVLEQPADGATVTLWQEFKWTDVNAAKYVVEIRSRASGGQAVEKTLEQNFFVLGQKEIAVLHDKEEYSWKVTAFVGSRTLSTAPQYFRFATMAATDEVMRLRVQALHAPPAELPKIIENLRQMLERYPTGASSAQIRSSIGDALLRARLPGKAVVEYQAALRIWESLGNPDVFDQQRTLSNFALASQRSGDFTSALTAYRTSHATLRNLTNVRFVRQRSNCAVNEGTLERRLGDYRAAKIHYEEALEIDRKLFADGVDDNESRIAEDLNNLGNLTMENLGDPEAGLVYLLQAREIHLRSQARNGRPDDNAADTEDSVGEAYRYLGHEADAIEQFKKALALEVQGTSDTTATDQLLNDLVDLLLQEKDLRHAFFFLNRAQKLNPKPNPDEWWRTEDLLGRYYLAAGYPAAGLEHVLRAIRTVQEFVATLPEGERAIYQVEHSRPYFTMARYLVSHGDSKRAYLCMESARGQSAMPGHENWCDPKSASQLPAIQMADSSVALAYFGGDSGEPVVRFFFVQDRVVSHELKTSNEIAAEIKEYSLTNDSGVEETIRRRLGADLLPDELSELLRAKAIKRILIMPDASLNKISFEAFIPSSGEEASHASLIDYAAVTLVPSILAWPSDAAKHDQRGDALIVTAAHQAFCPEALRLPWAEKEANDVAGFASSGSRHLSGAEAADAILGNEASHYRILHLAVHGQSAHNLNGSELMLDCSSDNTLRGDRIKAANLSGQLVVLSSCESAVGKTNSGGGIDSLADAFLQAGASCVIAARSTISDKSAYNLMVAELVQNWATPAGMQLIQLLLGSAPMMQQAS